MNPLRPAVTALATIALAASASVAAQPVPPPPPLPPESAVVPAPAAAIAGDPDLEPQVTIIRRDTETLEEVRIGGELKFIKVTPRTGIPYYLVPDASGRQYIRRDSLDASIKVPMWVLFAW
ncbi:MAG: DUF2782 domain-containing protein [Betaproteobacteria bacterium]|nr:DUF2782 domain-containing protein [Betaproteobacteria bacterium]